MGVQRHGVTEKILYFQRSVIKSTRKIKYIRRHQITNNIEDIYIYIHIYIYIYKSYQTKQIYYYKIHNMICDTQNRYILPIVQYNCQVSNGKTHPVLTHERSRISSNKDNICYITKFRNKIYKKNQPSIVNKHQQITNNTEYIFYKL